MRIDCKKTAPVGVFDSGVGGLTVAREISRQLPNENIGYGEGSVRKQVAEYNYPFFGADYPVFEDKTGESNRDRL